MNQNAASRKETLLALLLIAALSLFVISAAVFVPIFWRGFYYLHIDALRLPARTGFSAEEIRAAFDAMMDFEWKNAPFSCGTLKWSEEGRRHFADCRLLFHLDAYVLVCSALALLLLLPLSRRIGPRRFLGFHPAFYAGACTLLFFALVSLLAALDFNRAFVVFHRLFFPGKTNWIFDPRTDEIILILPQEYFRNCAVLAVSLIMLACAVLLFFGRRRRTGSAVQSSSSSSSSS